MTDPLSTSLKNEHNKKSSDGVWSINEDAEKRPVSDEHTSHKLANYVDVGGFSRED